MTKTREPAPALLFELGTEELPPRALKGLSEALGSAVRSALAAKGYCTADAPLVLFASPRRLACRILGVIARAPDQVVERRGPSVAAGLTASGEPTPALLGFARAAGVEIKALARRATDKGEWFFLSEHVRGERLAVALARELPEILKSLPIPRRMRWGAGTSEFVRPVHWAVLMHGQSVLRIPLLGVMTSRKTQGHRFLSRGGLSLPDALAYESVLKKAHVIASFETRRASIAAQAEAAARKAGVTVVMGEAALEEVCGLTEWPVPLLGHFDPEFLSLPPEVLTTAMQRHQKYFPVIDTAGALAPHFVVVANLPSRRPASVRAGNERVLRARFADARFFWQTDRKKPLADRVEALKAIQFQDRLGSLHDKTERVCAHVRLLAVRVGLAPDEAAQAAQLAKADLTTGLVGEFPELQGTMGRAYATAEGYPAQVAVALETQYWPRAAGEPVPGDALGALIGLVDRLDTLVGLFGIGLGPTGEKDPFALRRAGASVVRLLLESPLKTARLSLPELLEGAISAYGGIALPALTVAQVEEFIRERARSHFAGSFGHDEIEAVLAAGFAVPGDAQARLLALRHFRDDARRATLVSAHKRLRNILRNVEDPGLRPAPGWSREAAEQALFETWATAQAATEPLLARGEATAVLEHLASLGAPLARFFDEVLVMAEDPAVRRERLALLFGLHRLFLAVADLSHLKERV